MKISTNSLVMRRVSLFYWIALGVMSGLSSFVMPVVFTLGILAGGLLAIANFNVLRLAIQKVFCSGGIQQQKSGKKAFLMITFYIRLAVIGVIIYCLLATHLADPRGIAVGLSTVVIGIIAFGLLTAIKPSSREAL